MDRKCGPARYSPLRSVRCRYLWFVLIPGPLTALRAHFWWSNFSRIYVLQTKSYETQFARRDRRRDKWQMVTCTDVTIDYQVRKRCAIRVEDLSCRTHQIYSPLDTVSWQLPLLRHGFHLHYSPTLSAVTLSLSSLSSEQTVFVRSSHLHGVMFMWERWVLTSDQSVFSF